MYGPLNDFLPMDRRHSTFSHDVPAHSSVKDMLESVGVPHPEIFLILANGRPVSFDYGVEDMDRIAAFPRFTSIDIGSLACSQLPSAIRFVLDVHLGKLARHLRLLGLDAAYHADADDAELAATAASENRILLTRDVGLLKRRVVAYGRFVRDTRPHHQLVDVLRHFGPLPLAPFSRCLRCNVPLHEVAKSAVESALPGKTREHYDSFTQCAQCRRIYWKGSHWNRLLTAMDHALREAQG